MNFPSHQPYKNGKGGIDIGLKPIENSSWLEIDSLFDKEISIKKRLYKEKKDQVLITPPDSIDIQREVLELSLIHI